VESNRHEIEELVAGCLDNLHHFKERGIFTCWKTAALSSALDTHWREVFTGESYGSILKYLAYGNVTKGFSKYQLSRLQACTVIVYFNIHQVHWCCKLRKVILVSFNLIFSTYFGFYTIIKAKYLKKNIWAVFENYTFSMYMVLSRDQNKRKNFNIQIGNKSFKGVKQFKYLGIPFTDQNSVYEVKSRLKSRNACYHLELDLLTSGLLTKNVKIKNYNLSCCFIWVWNLVAHIEGGT
jgi:hypothetical protein